jgi:hypothetical protein
MQGYPYTPAAIEWPFVISAVSHACLQTSADDNDVSVVRLETALADGHVLVRRVVSLCFICKHCSVDVLGCICILQRFELKWKSGESTRAGASHVTRRRCQGSFNRGSSVLIAAQCAVAYRYILQGHLLEIYALVGSTRRMNDRS